MHENDNFELISAEEISYICFHNKRETFFNTFGVLCFQN